MLHFESTGEGPAVLLIMGLGLPGDAWWRTVPVLARSLRVVTFDNRGCGRSERPAGPLTLAGMAADAVSVLDAAGIARAHVYGISMGGMIAQELALRYPERVDSLVLGATSAGGVAATPPDRETLAFLGRRATVPDEEGRWASVPYVYSERTRRTGGAAHRRGLRAPAGVPVRSRRLRRAARGRDRRTTRRRGSGTSPRRRSSCTAPRTGWSRRRTAARSPRRSRARACSSSTTRRTCTPPTSPPPTRPCSSS